MTAYDASLIRQAVTIATGDDGHRAEQVMKTLEVLTKPRQPHPLFDTMMRLPVESLNMLIDEWVWVIREQGYTDPATVARESVLAWASFINDAEPTETREDLMNVLERAVSLLPACDEVSE